MKDNREDERSKGRVKHGKPETKVRGREGGKGNRHLRQKKKKKKTVRII